MRNYVRKGSYLSPTEGNEVRQKLLSLNLGPSELARKLGLNPTAVGRYLAGTCVPSPKTHLQIMEALAEMEEGKKIC